MGDAGLTMEGTPAMKAVASFSSMPHTGKLNALICTSTPLRGVRRCTAENDPSRDSGSVAPSTATVELGSSRRAVPAYDSSTLAPPSMSIQESARVAPVQYERS